MYSTFLILYLSDKIKPQIHHEQNIAYPIFVVCPPPFHHMPKIHSNPTSCLFYAMTWDSPI